jgi:hypothetical protein
VRGRRSLALPLSVAVIALVVLWALPQLSRVRALSIFILLLTAIALAVLVRRIRDGDGPRGARRFEAALRRRPATQSPPVELLRVERELELGVANALHAHRRLLPLLRAAAAARIGSRHGFELERRPEAARALLGEDVWELLRPDRPEPADRHGPGVPRRRVTAVIDRLEAL